jgi:3-hydroxyisobutyrate dehydrogenase
VETDPVVQSNSSFVLAPTATKIPETARGRVLVCGSHAGAYAGYLTVRAGVRAVILNDAGVGRDDAGPALTVMGRRILHAGPLGSASVLKVVTNYLCSVHLVALGEAMMVAKQAGMDLDIAFQAIRISSGNSFVHETESQVILNGSYNINFTMDLVVKDMGLFDGLAERLEVPLELSPVVLDIFKDGQARYGGRAWSSMIVKRLEDACGTDLRAPGFPDEIVDDEAEEPGYEIVV